MYGYVLQDWITVRGSTTTTFVQNESEWMGFSSFQDIAFWVDMREVTGTVTMSLQTAPTKDESLFQTLTNCTTVAAVTLAVVKNVLASNPAIPLSTWVRWILNGPASTWDCTFRILASANRVTP